MSDIRPIGGNWKSAVKRCAWYVVCQAAWRIESMKRLLFVATVLALFVLPAYAAEPSGNWKQYSNISFTQPTGAGWYATHIYHFPVGLNDLRHNLYADTYNYTEWPNTLPGDNLQVPVAGVPVIFWCSGEDTYSPLPESPQILKTWLDKPMDEDAVNFAIYKNQTCKAAVYDGRPSAIVSGITTALPDEGDDVKWGHHSWRVYFTYIEPTPEVTPTNQSTPTPVPTWTPIPTVTPVVTPTPTLKDILNAAWNRVYPSGGIPYNPEAGFPRIARERGLGVPVTVEFDIGSIRVQGFAGGILYAEIGKWDNIMAVKW